MFLHAILTAILNLLSFGQNIKIVAKKPNRCLVGCLKHIKGKVSTSHDAYLTFALVLYLTKHLMLFRTAHGTPLPFDKGNKRLVTIVHRRCYTTEDAVKCCLVLPVLINWVVLFRASHLNEYKLCS